MTDESLSIVPQETVLNMPDQAETEPEPEQDEPSSEVIDIDEPEPEPEPKQDDESEDDEDSEPEMYEFDFGGNKKTFPKDSIPPELAKEIEDFTKGTWRSFVEKSEKNANMAKELKAKQQSLEKIETLQGEALQMFGKGQSIAQELKQLNALNMQQLWQSDPDRARQLTDLKAQRQAELQETITLVDRYESQIDQQRQQEVARLSQDGERVLNSRYKNFTQEIAPKLVDYVVNTYGMDKAQAENWRINPVMTEMAVKAMKFDEMQRASKKPKAKQNEAQPVKSAVKAKKSTASNDPSRMTTEQYVEWRRKQMNGQR